MCNIRIQLCISYLCHFGVFFDRMTLNCTYGKFHLHKLRAHLSLFIVSFFFSLLFFPSPVSITSFIRFSLFQSVCNCFESSPSYNKFIALLSSHCFDDRSAWNTITGSHVGLETLTYACFANKKKKKWNVKLTLLTPTSNHFVYCFKGISLP